MFSRRIQFLMGLIFLVSCTNSKFDTDDIERNNANAQNPENTAKGPLGDVLFADTSFLFGNIQEGEMVQHTYTFTNTGKAPVSISNVTAQCGCTTPEYTQDIVAPGKNGKVTATFNSAGRGGPMGILNEKSITVQLDNSKTPQVVLKFKAYVFAKKGNASDEVDAVQDEIGH